MFDEFFSIVILIGYAGAGWFLYERAIMPTECGVQKTKRVFLGTSFLCFASARFLSLFDIRERWLYDCGHILLITFAIVYVASGYVRDKRGEIK